MVFIAGAKIGECQIRDVLHGFEHGFVEKKPVINAEISTSRTNAACHAFDPLQFPTASDEMYPEIMILVVRRRSFSDGQARFPTVLLLRIRY